MDRVLVEDGAGVQQLSRDQPGAVHRGHRLAAPQGPLPRDRRPPDGSHRSHGPRPQQREAAVPAHVVLAAPGLTARSGPAAGDRQLLPLFEALAAVSRKRWIKRAQLAILIAIGISAVSIPVTLAVVLSATTEDSPLTLATAAATRAPAVPKNPAKAVAQTLKCEAKTGYYALTFDDGPYPETTDRLVGALAGAGAVATFFDVGQRADARPDLVQLQRTVGQVANHSYTHAHLPVIPQERRLQELTETARALGHPNAFVRPPYGETSPTTDADIHKTGLVPVYWTTDTFDWQRPPVDVIARRALEVKPGGIVLLHDGRENTILAVPRIVSELRSRGMCPGFLAQTDATVLSAYGQTPFHVVAVSPQNDSGRLSAADRPGRP